MSKALVLYQTTSGYTKKYAQWISEALAADLSELKDFNASKLTDYDLIIFGGSLHAVGISGIKVIKENLPQLTGKKLVVFAVGASPPRKNTPKK
jgi:flavodoxin